MASPKRYMLGRAGSAAVHSAGYHQLDFVTPGSSPRWAIHANRRLHAGQHNWWRRLVTPRHQDDRGEFTAPQTTGGDQNNPSRTACCFTQLGIDGVLLRGGAGQPAQCRAAGPGTDRYERSANPMARLTPGSALTRLARVRRHALQLMLVDNHYQYLRYPSVPAMDSGSWPLWSTGGAGIRPLRVSPAAVA